MYVKRDHQRSVAFLCVDTKEGRVPSATAFLIEVPDDAARDGTHQYFVTARHCVENAGAELLWVRVNTSTGSHDIETRRDDWYTHDHADVALIPASMPDLPDVEVDIVAMPVRFFSDASWRYPGPFFGRSGNKEIANPRADEGGWPIAPGDDVYFVGLFAQEAGEERNLPIARFGAISRMPEEPVALKRDRDTVFRQYAYLVECQSWGGHSGSPAFWAAPGVMVTNIDGHMMPMPPFRNQGLLGLVSGHAEIGVKASVSGSLGNDELTVRTGVNVGIAYVTPASFILELLGREDVVESRNRV